MYFKNVLLLVSTVFCLSFIALQAKENKKTNDWVTFQYATQLNQEVAEVKFPTYPEEFDFLCILKYSGVKMFVVKELDVDYTFTISLREDLSDAEILANYLELVSEDYVVLSQKMHEKKGLLMCDLELEADGTYRNVRAIISKKCLYELETEYNDKNTVHQHETFVNSFKIN